MLHSHRYYHCVETFAVKYLISSSKGLGMRGLNELHIPNVYLCIL